MFRTTAPLLRRLKPGGKKLKQLVTETKVPHKERSNDTTEVYWKFGRHLCQCKRMSIHYCPHGASSRGVRHWLDYEAHKFVAANPQIAVYVVERENRAPEVKANYMNDVVRTAQLNNLDDTAIWDWIDRFRNESGRDWQRERLKKPWISTQPSIQGTWNPFMYKPVVDVNTDNFVGKEK